MKLRLFFQSLAFVLIFAAGVLLQLGLSSSIVWAEIEASGFGMQINTSQLNLNCPLMLSSTESGTVVASIVNTLDQQVSPLVTFQASNAAGMRVVSETVSLAPHETKHVSWHVSQSDLIFGRLILVNVIQARDGDLDVRRSFCGILLFNLFNLTGSESLVLIFISSVVLILVGGALWIHISSPLDSFSDQTIKICGGLAGFTTFALITALPRWWGLALFLDAFALIILSVIITDFVLFPKTY